MQVRHREVDRTQRPLADAPIGGGAPDADSAANPQVSDGQGLLVHHGIHSGTFRVGGLTVTQARRLFERQMNISPDAVAVIAGEIVENEDERVLQDTDNMLSFVQRSSVKGRMGCPGGRARGAGSWRAAHARGVGSDRFAAAQLRGDGTRPEGEARWRS